jgi:uncharacterized cupredoxin-like copper-binding protein
MRNPRQCSRRVGTTALIVSSLLLLAGCGAAGQAQHGSGTIRVSERDFKIGASRVSVRAGKVDLVVDNHGPEAHELIVARENDQGLALRSDGLTVNEEALKPYEAGSLEPGQAGRVRRLQLDLKPGRYVLFCNMSGHYLGGMHTELVVH